MKLEEADCRRQFTGVTEMKFTIFYGRRGGCRGYPPHDMNGWLRVEKMGLR